MLWGQNARLLGFSSRRNPAMPHRAHRTVKQTLFCLIVMGSCLSGCTTTSFFSRLRLKEVDGAKAEDPWTTQAGSEGRAGRPVEREADPLNLKQIFMSEKAREIERNCGIE